MKFETNYNVGGNLEIILNNPHSGSIEYRGFLEDDNTVSFSSVFVVCSGELFNKDNWKSVLGPDHLFVKISEKIPTKVKAIDDTVTITVDVDDMRHCKIN